MKKVIICDDVEVERHSLKVILQQYARRNSGEISVTEYDSGETLLADAEEGCLDMDLLFLDIYMKELDGMDVARSLRKASCTVPIIFLSGSSEFAVESYEVQASGYLLKPVVPEKLEELLDRILKNGNKKRIAVKSRRQHRYLYTDDILYIDSDRHTVTIHLADGSQVTTMEKLGELESRIKEARFLRCHQSYLVNMDYVKDIQENFLLKNGIQVPIRVRGRKEVLDQYYSYFVCHFTGSRAN